MNRYTRSIIVAIAGFFVAVQLQAAQAPANFVIPPDVPARYASNIRPAPSYVDARVLAANTAETHTMPSNTRFVLFASNCGAFYVNVLGGTAAVPAADVTDGSASELNPTAYYWTTPPTSISLISPTTCIVTMSVYLGPVR